MRRLMNRRKAAHALCCTLLSMAVAGVVSPVTADCGSFYFELGYDPVTMSSAAIVHGTISEADIAVVNGWEGRLPVGYDTTGSISYVPTRLLGELRDQLEVSQATEAGDALGWIREKMGAYSSTPTQDIATHLLSAMTGSEKSYFCGKKALPDGHCPSDCTPSDNPKTCTGCGCAGEKTFPDACP
ncbi:MAG: hypothetical protein Q9Q40_03700 [Acidobacteriota bacterium]|nr:hypothetical protein [Acidobacteriota bacterium]